ncbi:CBS domain-containing protein [Eubacterium limosum]|uniref:CBS domain-containing protein n=1 Tax=Eubacterium limosum TaxID=1736 RepID=A0ABT5ULF0_EUBLI|nr:CBS domain-containing protein [Eubacterium limosum]MCB6570152.1 CBS domain-containing protein [Eubacterium limosum]MDE1469723.1 CBS domain-containing protein [Eubacterium limosum]
MNRPISDIMDKDVYTCHYSQTLEEAVKILVDKKVGGLTVIDDNRHVIGFISDGDIMKAVAKQKTRSIAGWNYSSMVLYDNESFEEKVEDLKKRNVMELATKRVFCVTPVQPIGEVAEILSSKKIKKIPIVTADGALVGVARRSTIMRYIFNMLFNSDNARISNV